MTTTAKSGCLVAILFIALSVTSGHAAQNIQTDPFLRDSLAIKNWLPGNPFFTFSARGTVDNNSTYGAVTINPTGKANLGSYTLENATIKGQYGYMVRFSNHPWTEHSPFTNVREDTYEATHRVEGSNTSYSIQSKGTETHKADAYDPPQGGGYPYPVGANDQYAFSITGIATGVYLTSSMDQQLGDRPDVWGRFMGFEATMDRHARQWIEDSGDALVLLFHGEGWKNKLRGGVDVVSSLFAFFGGGIAATFDNFGGTEALYYLKDFIVADIERRSILNRYMVVGDLSSLQGWFSDKDNRRVFDLGSNLLSGGASSLKKSSSRVGSRQAESIAIPESLTARKRSFAGEDMDYSHYGSGRDNQQSLTAYGSGRDNQQSLTAYGSGRDNQIIREWTDKRLRQQRERKLLQDRGMDGFIVISPSY